MFLQSIEVHNYRSLKDASLQLDDLTVLVGPNGAGKSSFLRALDFFFTEEQFDIDDFYNRNTTQDIDIIITFAGLSELDKDFFKEYVQGDNLVVAKRTMWVEERPKTSFHGSKLYCSDFHAFRTAKGTTELKAAYSKIKESIGTLPDYKIKAEAEVALAAWELANPQNCERRIDDGQFFGWKNVGGSYLKKRIERVFIRAVRDAKDISIDKKGTPIFDMMEIVARRTLAGRKEWQNLITRTKTDYDRIMQDITNENLVQVSQSLNSMLTSYAPNAGVEVEWDEGIVDLPPPSAKIRVIEDGFPSPVHACGHGVQRAFILTLLQYLASLQRTTNGENPSLLVVIEEPELYQHPTRQRHLSRILFQLAQDEETQVIYSTHSPLLVDIGRYSRVRRISKEMIDTDLPQVTTVNSAAGEELIRELERVDLKDEGSYTREFLESKMQNLMPSWMNEGFFANTLVLVEGLEDQAILSGVAEYLGHNFDALGISIIPCGGKGSICYPSRVFENLRIPVFVIWDSDFKRGVIATNRKLLRMVGCAEEDWPKGIGEKHAAFEEKMVVTFIDEVGKDEFEKELKAVSQSWLLSPKRAKKNQKVLKYVVHELAKRGLKSDTMEDLIKQILSFHDKSYSV